MRLPVRLRRYALLALSLISASCLPLPVEPIEVLFGCAVSTVDAPCTKDPVAVALDVALDSIAAGDGHTCAITAAGETWCWGDGRNGRIGNGLARVELVPVRLTGAYSEVRPGGQSGTCGRSSSGTISCWGEGPLGTASVLQSLVPIAVDGGNTYLELAAGTRHNCGLLANGGVECWGSGFFGALGNGTVVDSPTPTRVLGTLVFRQITAGQDFTCGLTTDSEVYCWGLSFGQVIGTFTEVCNFSPFPCSPIPVRVAVGWMFRRITASANAVCGLTTAGQAVCWGENGQGQLGSAGFGSSPVPIPVEGLGTAGLNAISSSSASFHVCGITAGGDLFCWGSNFSGELGAGVFDAGVNRALRAAGTRRFRAVAPGREHTCAIDLAGRAHCWGSTSRGKMGSG